LSTKDHNRTIEYFSQRAKSAFFRNENDRKPLGTFDAFHEFAYYAPKAAKIWLQRLTAIKRDEIEAIVYEVPDDRMSGIAKQFTLELLLVNQK